MRCWVAELHPPHRQLQWLTDLAEGLAFIAVLDLETPHLRRARDGQRLVHLEMTLRGKTHLLARLRGPREPYRIAIEGPFLHVSPGCPLWNVSPVTSGTVPGSGGGTIAPSIPSS